MNQLARETLCDIIATHGRQVCEDPRQLRGLLADRCPALKRESHVLCCAAEINIASDLLRSSASNQPWEVVSGRLVRRLVEEVAITEAAARWAVETWAAALGTRPAGLTASPPPGRGESPTGTHSHPALRATSAEDASANPGLEGAGSGTPSVPPASLLHAQPHRRASRRTWAVLGGGAVCGLLALVAALALGPTRPSTSDKPDVKLTSGNTGIDKKKADITPPAGGDDKNNAPSPNGNSAGTPPKKGPELVHAANPGPGLSASKTEIPATPPKNATLTKGKAATSPDPDKPVLAKPDPANLCAAIEVGAKGVKAVVLERKAGTNVDGLRPAGEMKKASNTSVADVVEGRFREEALRETVDAVGDFFKDIYFERGIDDVCIVISSGVATAARNNEQELQRLKERIAGSVVNRAKGAAKNATHPKTSDRQFTHSVEDVAAAVTVVTVEQELIYTIKGLEAIRRWKWGEVNDRIFVDVGSGSTKVGYYEQESDDSTAVSGFRVIQGDQVVPGTMAFSKLIDQERKKRETETKGLLDSDQLDQLRAGLAEKLVAEPLEDSTRRKPRIVNARKVYLSGGIVWSLVTILQPEQVNAREIVLTADDIHRFRKLLRDKPGAFPVVPNESTLTKEAADEIRRVRDTFSPSDLAAGADVLVAIASACRMENKAAVFDRDSYLAWISYLARNNPLASRPRPGSSSTP